jgi:hypothetical protein
MTTVAMTKTETYKRNWYDDLHCETPNGHPNYEEWRVMVDLRIFEIKDSADNVVYRMGQGYMNIRNRTDDDGSVVEGDILIPSRLEQWEAYEWASAWVETQKAYLTDSFEQAAKSIQDNAITEPDKIYRSFYKFVDKGSLQANTWESWDVTAVYDSHQDGF